MTSWKENASSARARRDQSIAKVEPKIEGIPEPMPLSSQGFARVALTAREIEITEKYSVSELLRLLWTRRLSVEEVTRAFLRRAGLAQIATNCLTELLWDQAIRRAKELDQMPSPKGQFFGLPISVKEHLGMIGKDVVTHASYAAWVDKPHGSNVLLDSLWDQGCVFIARSTQPQCIMHLETESNLYGRTTNPHNRNLTSGGSSGGEAALVGMRGSIMGIGGDIGGSIRAPAAHCGIYGFKPTTKRLSTQGLRVHMTGKETVMSTAGPMTTDRESLELFMKVALSTSPWRIDPSITAKPWTPHKFSRPLKIAVQWWDGIVRPHPPMIRALKEVASACQKAGMTVIDWNCESLNHRQGWELLSSLYFPDGGKHILDLLDQSGEPELPLTKFVIREQASIKNMSQQELWDACAKRDRFRATYACAWNKTADKDGQEVDVILCPPYFGAASTHEMSRYWGYTSIWNLLDYPGAVFPVTTVDPNIDKKDSNYQPENDEDQFVHSLYDPDVYANAPIGLQVIGRRQEDEKVLAALAEIERAMGR